MSQGLGMQNIQKARQYSRPVQESAHTQQDYSKLWNRRATGFILRGSPIITTKSPLAFIALILMLPIAVLIVGCKRSSETAGGFAAGIQPLPKQHATYQPMQIPPDNPFEPEEGALDPPLFFGERPSGDG